MHRETKLVWKIYFYFLPLLIILLTAVTLFSVSTIKKLYLHQLESDLKIRADTLNEIIEKSGEALPARIDSICKTYGPPLATRFTVIANDGAVIGDTDNDPAKMENHSDRPEVRKALSLGEGVSSRYSFTLKKDLLYVAVPLKMKGETVGVVRASIPVTQISSELHSLYVRILFAAVVMAFLAASASYFISNLIARPLSEMKDVAMKFARGELKERLNIKKPGELAALARAMNKMAEELDDRIAMITRQKNELEAVLKNMLEAVILLDADEKILRCNRAAGVLFGVDSRLLEGRNIQEAIRNSKLNEFTGKVFSSQGSLVEEITILDPQEKFLQATGTTLKSADGKTIGALIVLNDITKMKKLEEIRKDFVSNVSHELKTPITSIKGFVETLKEGEIDDPEVSKKFLGIISTHADRLNLIIEDLLRLSRIEQSEEKTPLELEESGILSLVSNAVLICETNARANDIKIGVLCDENLRFRINSPFLELAVTNLLDNAIKYSDKGKQVSVKVSRTGESLIIEVADQGFGIPKEHLSRIFERFYRVDKARSRKMGGTGLGLAIVKHIVQAHSGTLTVESAVGIGSTFTIKIPQKRAS